MSAPASACAVRQPLVERLRDPRRYPHPAQRIELLETHISWVLLTGSTAYKLKKPLDLGFLDFSTLEARKRACEDELRLNRRTAPELYLGVVPITGTEEEPAIDGSGRAIEYAVMMREFPQEALLDSIAMRGELRIEQMDDLAAAVAAFHANVERAGSQSEFGTTQEVIARARQNFEQIRPLTADAESLAALARLATWTEREFADRRYALDARHREGFVRECHGDMHLRNLVLIEGRIVPFDCIEFNASLRWIDVMSEVAFLVMDFADHGLFPHAWRFLDAYLAQTGDYDGLALLRFYLVYRAMVRAKVACMRAHQLSRVAVSLSDPRTPAAGPHLRLSGATNAPLSVEAAERASAEREFRGYLQLAEQFAALDRRALVITRGVSGSGKTLFSGFLVEEIGTVRVRSDIERKRLHGLTPGAQTGAEVGGGIYGPDATRRTYGRLREVARAILEAGFPAIIDATFLARADRDAFRALARKLGVPFAIAACEAPEPVLRERVESRVQAAVDASEATLEVLAQQLVTAEPIAGEERTFTVMIDTQLGLQNLRIRARALWGRLGVASWPPTTAQRIA